MSSSLSTRGLLALALSWLALVALAAAQPEPSDGAEPPEATPAEAGSEGSTTPPAAQPEAETAAAPGIRVQAFAGFGFGTRSFERPTAIGGQRLPTAVFPAVDLGLSALAWPKQSFSLAVLLRYQTSIGMTIEERPPFALPNHVRARSERAELSAAPSFRLGDLETAPVLSFPLGVQIRTLWPEVLESMTPGYSLIGPHVRVELIARLTPAFVLRFGPELQWIVAIDRSIRRDGVANQGYSMGGEAAARLELGTWFALELCYRESHASASSTNAGPIFSDVERFLTARFSGTL